MASYIELAIQRGRRYANEGILGSVSTAVKEGACRAKD